MWTVRPIGLPLRCAGDNIVVIRAASRTDPSDSDGQLQLDFGKGVIIQRNIAGTGMERLRKVRGVMHSLVLFRSGMIGAVEYAALVDFYTTYVGVR